MDIDDAQSQEWQLIENSQRIDVHPYEEAQAFDRLLHLPGYDVAALVEKSGKSASHIYARLSLLQLIPEVAKAFTEERITASHANLIARLPRESQAAAYENAWRKDYQDKEPHLLPAKNLAAWIQANLYLWLADAPFDREDPTLNPTAGACTTCPRRTGYNTALFADAVADDCLDSICYGGKVETFLDREIAAHPGLVQIENGYRIPKQQRPGAVRSGHFREIAPMAQNPDAEPVFPCAATRTAIVVYGKRIGRTFLVCTDNHCPVHDPRAAAQVSKPVSSEAPASEAETETEAEERKAKYAQERKDYKAEQEAEQTRRAEERRREYDRQREEHEAEQAKREALQNARLATFDRILDHAPAVFSAAQLRVLLRVLVNLDPYTFAEGVAEYFAGDNENRDQTPEEVLLAVLDEIADGQLTRFALRLALTGHIAIPRENEADFLTEAALAFAPPQPNKAPVSKKRKKPTPIKPASKTATKKSAPKKKTAA